METTENKKKIYKIMKVVVMFLIVICAGKILFGFDSFGNRGNENNQRTITFTGHGEVSAVPDIANVSFSIVKEAKTVKEAQTEVLKIETKVLSFLRENKIADKDIKTSNASFYPKYEYKYSAEVACGAYTCPPRPSKEVISGYEFRETITLKIRNTDDVGKIVQGLGTLGVSDLNGPNFTIDNEDGLKADARKKAIDDAKSKAKVLAKDLGVRLGKISSFNENGNYPMPMYAKSGMMDSMTTSAAVLEMPKGENIISSDVTIVYELK